MFVSLWASILSLYVRTYVCTYFFVVMCRLALVCGITHTNFYLCYGLSFTRAYLRTFVSAIFFLRFFEDNLFDAYLKAEATKLLEAADVAQGTARRQAKISTRGRFDGWIREMGGGRPLYLNMYVRTYVRRRSVDTYVCKCVRTVTTDWQVAPQPVLGPNVLTY